MNPCSSRQSIPVTPHTLWPCSLSGQALDTQGPLSSWSGVALPGLLQYSSLSRLSNQPAKPQSKRATGPTNRQRLMSWIAMTRLPFPVNTPGQTLVVPVNQDTYLGIPNTSTSLQAFTSILPHVGGHNELLGSDLHYPPCPNSSLTYWRLGQYTTGHSQFSSSPHEGFA